MSIQKPIPVHLSVCRSLSLRSCQDGVRSRRAACVFATDIEVVKVIQSKHFRSRARDRERTIVACVKRCRQHTLLRGSRKEGECCSNESSMNGLLLMKRSISFPLGELDTGALCKTAVAEGCNTCISFGSRLITNGITANNYKSRIGLNVSSLLSGISMYDQKANVTQAPAHFTLYLDSIRCIFLPKIL